MQATPVEMVSPEQGRRLLVDGAIRPGASPFRHTVPGVVAAAAFGVGCLVWLAVGDRLRGGRWIVVHMFALGVLTVLIWTFSRHFAARFTGAADRG